MNRGTGGGGGKAALVAVDLDQTLIYSPDSVGRLTNATGTDDLHQVEAHLPSGTRSYVAAALPAQLDALRARATVVPVTTRTRAQFERIAPLGSVRFDLSVCSNGGTLLVNGEPDPTWAAEVSDELAQDGWRIDEVAAYLDGLGLDRKATRLADGMFCYLVAEDVEKAASKMDAIQVELEDRGWTACLSGRKVYATPALLTKAAAVKRLAMRLGADVVVAIGDSVLDVPMLEAADYAIAPAHADAPVRKIADHVTRSTGPLAATEALGAAVAWLDLG